MLLIFQCNLVLAFRRVLEDVRNNGVCLRQYMDLEHRGEHQKRRCVCSNATTDVGNYDVGI